MKRLLFISYILVFLTCCDSMETRRLLVKAEAQLEEHPESAFAILDGIKTASDVFSKDNRMRHRLLLAYSMSKLGMPLDTFLSIKEAAGYYGKRGNGNNRMLANYMLGSVYRDKGDAPMALHYFQEAINVADTTDRQCDFRMLSRIYGQTAALFYNQRSPETELEMERRAEYYALKAKDTLSAIIFYENTADAYYMLGNYDSVLYICQNASKRYMKYGRKDLASANLAIVLEIATKRGDYNMARRVITDYEAHSGYFDKDGNIEAGREIYYSMKGDYYCGTGQLDSAQLLYRKLLNYPDDIYNLENGYKGLLSIYRKRNNPDSIAKYAVLFAQMNDSACVLSSSEEINRMKAIYDYSENRRLAELKTKEAEGYRNVIYIMTVVAVTVIYIIYRYTNRQKQIRKMEMLDINTRYYDALSRFEELHKIKSSMEKGFEHYKVENEKEQERLRHILMKYQEEDLSQNKWDTGQTLLSSPIVARMHKLAQRGAFPSVEEWNGLFALAETAMPAFLNSINKENAGLTEKEKKVCILTRLLFIPTEIASLLDTTKQNITNMRSNINRKLFHANGTRSFDANIRRC